MEQIANVDLLQGLISCPSYFPRFITLHCIKLGRRTFDFCAIYCSWPRDSPLRWSASLGMRIMSGLLRPNIIVFHQILMKLGVVVVLMGTITSPIG